MADPFGVQILLDGPRNTVIKVDGIAATSNLAYTIIANPATLFGIDNAQQIKSPLLSIQKITHVIQDGLSVGVFWDAATPVICAELFGRSKIESKGYGSLSNNAVSPSGQIGISTAGWTSGPLTYTIIFELIKVGGVTVP
jgi:hypothetical protein